VIAIFAILAAMFQPDLAKAKDHAKSISSGNNYKQMGLAPCLMRTTAKIISRRLTASRRTKWSVDHYAHQLVFRHLARYLRLGVSPPPMSVRRLRMSLPFRRNQAE